MSVISESGNFIVGAGGENLLFNRSRKLDPQFEKEKAPGFLIKSSKPSRMSPTINSHKPPRLTAFFIYPSQFSASLVDAIIEAPVSPPSLLAKSFKGAVTTSPVATAS